MADIKWRRFEGGYALHRDGTVVAQVHKTGTHLDHYPWDWMLERVEDARRGARRTTGSTDTLAHAKGEVLDALGIDWRTMEPYAPCETCGEEWPCSNAIYTYHNPGGYSNG